MIVYESSQLEINFQNVDSSFAVVVVTEEMERSLYVLEKTLPRYFAGALQTYEQTDPEKKYFNTNYFRPIIKQESLSRLSRHFKRELDFYHYCKQKLNKQYLALRQIEK